MATELQDESAIRNVVLAYCRGIDRMDRELVRSCYCEDATEVHGSFDGTIDEYLEWVWTLLSRYERTHHFIGNLMIELRGDRAHAETYGIASHEGDPSDATRNLTVGFRYLDRFERRAGEWRIVRRVAVTDWCRYSPHDTRWEVPAHLLRGSRGSTDPVYESRTWLDG